MTVAARTVGGQARRPETRLANTERNHECIDTLESVKRTGSPATRSGRPVEPLVAEWSPLVDISEDDKEYLIKAELPEVKKEDVKVTAEDGTLTIMGERKFEKAEKNKKYHRVERAYGSFGRSFSFPDDASPGKVSADFKDGVLTVHLAKVGKAKPQQVEINVS